MANLKWDNKFGMIKVDGVGKNAEIVTNAKGGKQSKSPTALHLLDPEFLNGMFYGTDKVISNISEFMTTGNKMLLITAIIEIQYIIGGSYLDSLITIGKVLKEGARKYAPNNWRLIPQEDHLNHALIHYVAYLLGDTQDNHLEHCMCRLMMAYAIEPTENFSYTGVAN